MTNLDRRVLIGMAGIAGAAAVSRLARAGSLDPPPGPVAPTGKTTDQIQPRIDLLNAPPSANVTSDANNQYIINNPGSYFLSANLAITKSVGIKIVAANVSLDLCGFQLAGAGTSTFTGIAVAGSGAWIGNGSLLSLQYGVNVTGAATACTLSRVRAAQCASVGLSLPRDSIVELCVADNNGYGISGSANCVLRDCTASSNTQTGFFADAGSTLTRCTGSANGFSGISTQGHCTLTECVALSNASAAAPGIAGILVGSSCVLQRCISAYNRVTYGISMGVGTSVIDCSVSSNTGSAADARSSGIEAADGCLISGCTVIYNAGSANTASNGVGIACSGQGTRVENCVVYSNTGSGISILDSRCAVKGCELSANGFDGITVTGSSTSISENRCVGNNNGIHVVSGSAHVVERNHLLDNAVNGLQIDSNVCFVYANLARSNPTNYSIAAGNRVGEIAVAATNASAINGNSGGAAVTSDPYCNIAF